MPSQLQVCLPYRRSTEVSSSGSVSYAIGLFNYLNQLPLYAAALYQFYKYSRIRRVDVEVQLNGQTGGTAYGIDLALGRLPYAEFTSALDTDLVAQTSGAVHSKSGLYGGRPITLRKSYDCENILGNRAAGVEVWQTYAQASSGTPTDVQLPLAVFAMASTPNIGTFNASVTISVYYHVEFFELDATPQVLLDRLEAGKNQPSDFTPIPDTPRRSVQTLEPRTLTPLSLYRK